MKLTTDQIQKFRQLHLKHFGESISTEEAHEQGLKLLMLMQVIYKPMTDSEYQQFQIAK